MKFTTSGKVSKNSMFPVLVGLTFTLGALALFLPAKRQYSTGTIVKKEDEKDKGALEMAQYFFQARKDVHTNGMNYQAMSDADVADRLMSSVKSRRHQTTSSTTLPEFTWNSLGPTNIGGRTRAILIDNNDATHQTIFAGGVSGGIWKSTNGGSTWGNTVAALSYSINDTLANMNVACIAQSPNGTIYIGTGEGFQLYSQGDMFSCGMIGGGIFSSTDDGNTWTSLPSTVPANNNDVTAWAYTNRIAVQPNNGSVIYAATNGGLQYSTNGGVSWNYVRNSASNAKLSGGDPSFDVTVSIDGSLIVACAGGKAYYCYPSSADNWEDSLFTEMPHTGAGLLPTGYLYEFAISPTDPNRVYVLEMSNNSGGLGTFNSTSGIYFTETAKTNGGYWYLIGPGGGPFDPFHSAYDQCDYDNCLAVDPSNEGRLVLGGVTIYQWEQVNNADTIGSWLALTYYGFPHPDQHALVFDLNTPSVLYNGNDGGVYKSFDGGNTWGAFNRNYDVTQYYAIAFSPDNTYGAGVGGGTQDNGSPYIPGNQSPNPLDGVDMTGGDGGQSIISQLNGNIAFFSSDDGILVRTGNLGTLTFPSGFYNTTIGDSAGANIDSIYALGTACFVLPLALYENSYDTLNKDLMVWVADKNYYPGDTAYPLSNNGDLTFPYIVSDTIAAGKSDTIPNRVVSKLATAFSASDGIWVTAQAIDQTDLTIWMPIGGPKSLPDACTGGPVHCLAWSPDGNTLWAGTEDEGYLYRFTNMNSIIGNKFITGALWYEKPGHGVVYTGNANINCKKITLPSTVSSRDIISISVDPQDTNKVMFTLGNYGEADYVYYSGNAMAASPTFTVKQGNLPTMPVYGSILDIKNGFGPQTWGTNTAMIATEHGIYTTNDITATSPVWTKNGSDIGFPNVLVAGIKQQIMEPWNCNNSGNIYAGTHGRGIWYSDSTFVPTGIPSLTSNKSSFIGLTVYPNPMSTQGTLEFTLNNAENLIMTVYDIQGKEVFTQQLGMQTEGKHLVPFQVSSLNSGAYFISLKGDNYKQVAKFVVQK